MQALRKESAALPAPLPERRFRLVLMAALRPVLPAATQTAKRGSAIANRKKTPDERSRAGNSFGLRHLTPKRAPTPAVGATANATPAVIGPTFCEIGWIAPQASDAVRERTRPPQPLPLRSTSRAVSQ